MKSKIIRYLILMLIVLLFLVWFNTNKPRNRLSEFVFLRKYRDLEFYLNYRENEVGDTTFGIYLYVYQGNIGITRKYDIGGMAFISKITNDSIVLNRYHFESIPEKDKKYFSDKRSIKKHSKILNRSVRYKSIYSSRDEIKGVKFDSFSLSKGKLHLSFFHLNNLVYQREIANMYLKPYPFKPAQESFHFNDDRKRLIFVGKSFNRHKYNKLILNHLDSKD